MTLDYNKYLHTLPHLGDTHYIQVRVTHSLHCLPWLSSVVSVILQLLVLLELSLTMGRCPAPSCFLPFLSHSSLASYWLASFPSVSHSEPSRDFRLVPCFAFSPSSQGFYFLLPFLFLFSGLLLSTLKVSLTDTFPLFFRLEWRSQNSH